MSVSLFALIAHRRRCRHARDAVRRVDDRCQPRVVGRDVSHALDEGKRQRGGAPRGLVDERGRKLVESRHGVTQPGLNRRETHVGLLCSRVALQGGEGNVSGL